MKLLKFHSSPALLSPYVSLNRDGLPRIIPSFHRRSIKAGHHSVIKFYLSLLTVTKLIPLAPKVSRSTFSSIVTKPDHNSLQLMVEEMKPLMKDLLCRYVPCVQTIALEQRLKLLPKWQTIPLLARRWKGNNKMKTRL